jgi:putative NADH-flavin reductase
MRHHRIRLLAMSSAFMLLVLAVLGLAPAPAAAAGLKITVYGGTGRIGSHVVAEALRRSDTVTVVARNTSSALPAGVTVVTGNILDSKAVAQQIAGQDVVVSAVSGGFGPTVETEGFQQKVARSLVAALRSVKPRAPHLIVVGGASSLRVASTGSQLMLDTLPARLKNDPDNEMVGLTRALQYYQTVRDVDWSFLSPPLGLDLKSEQRTGKFRVGDDVVLRDARGKPSGISVSDLAVAIVDEAEHPQHIRRHFTVAY